MVAARRQLQQPIATLEAHYSLSVAISVVTDILHLHNQKLTAYKGDYDTFERSREELLKNQHKALEANEKARAHMQAFIDKFLYNAKRASLVQSRIKALDRMGTADAIINDPDYEFEFPTPDDRPEPPIISLRKNWRCLAKCAKEQASTSVNCAKGIPP